MLLLMLLRHAAVGTGIVIALNRSPQNRTRRDRSADVSLLDSRGEPATRQLHSMWLHIRSITIPVFIPNTVAWFAHHPFACCTRYAIVASSRLIHRVRGSSTAATTTQACCPGYARAGDLRAYAAPGRWTLRAYALALDLGLRRLRPGPLVGGLETLLMPSRPLPCGPCIPRLAQLLPPPTSILRTLAHVRSQFVRRKSWSCS